MFQSQRDGNGEIYTMEADGKNQLRLTVDLEYDGFPRWSPDGTKIVYVKGDSNVYMMTANGMDQKKIAAGARGRGLRSDVSPGPRWSPDGQKILFVSTAADIGLYLVNPDGTNQEHLTSGFDVYPAWSPLPQTTDADGDNRIKPAGYSLEQNYPNPFNPATVISYQLPGTSTLRLAVYDLLGHEVAVLVNERKAPGSYEVKFDASGLASGVYFYRLIAGSFIQTRKMLVIK